MLEEVLFIDFLVDDKGVIHKTVPEPGGGVQCLGLCALSTPYRGGYYGAYWEPMATPSTCSKNWPWKDK